MANPSAALDPFAPPTANLDPRLSSDGSDQPLAGRGTRLGAVILDGLLYTPFFLIGGAIGFFRHSGPWTPESVKSPMTMVGIFVSVLIACLPLASYQWYLQSTTGQSLGKRWSKIKIVKKDGSPVDFVSAVLMRTWVPAIAGWIFAFVGIQSIGNLYGLIDALLIFSSTRRCLHDLIAGTKVITLERL